MKNDIRKEQLSLLDFEKKVAGLAGVLAAGASTAAAAGDKIDSAAPILGHTEIADALVHLADVTDKVHANLSAQAIDTGLKLLDINGVPKRTLGDIVRSTLGLF